VDSDVDTYPNSRLRGWKVGAEAETLRSLNGSPEDDVYPQPAKRQHSPVPRIAGQLFAQARERLLESGWQPVDNHWSYASDSRIQCGNGPLIWARGYHELTDACPTGLAYCKFKYRDAYGNELTVVTAGELGDDDGEVSVWSWSIRVHEQLIATERDFSRLAAGVREEVARALHRTQMSTRARRDLAIATGGLGGSRERLYRDEVETRTKQLDAVARELSAIEAGDDPADRGRVLARLEALLVQVTSIGERSVEDKETFEFERSRLGRGA